MRHLIEPIESRLLLSVTPILTTAQKQDLTAIATELSVIHAGSNVTTTEVKAVVADFSQIAAVAHAPSQSSVQKLMTDAKADFAAGTITSVEKVQLTADVQAVLTSAGIPKSLASQTASGLKAIVTSSNMTKAETEAIFSDVSAFLNGFKS